LIVTTAAHCGTNHRTAIFGETRATPARTVPIEFCRTFSGAGGGATRHDWAFCKLTQPVMDVPIIPILMGCETDILKPGQKVVVAGFGRIEAGGTGSGTKRWVETTVNRVDTGQGIQVGGMGKAPCFGDSGGPAFVQLADGTWRVFGIDSVGTGASCAAGDLMTLIHKGVAWMEMQSGIDITPCHNADGTWNPSAACQGFSMSPLATGRAWANGCAEAQLSPPAATCGAPFGGGDGGPPPPGDAAARDTTPRPDTTPPAQDALSDVKPPSNDTAAGDVAREVATASDSVSGGGVDSGSLDAHSPGADFDAASDNRGAPGLVPAGGGGCSCDLGASRGSHGTTTWIALGLLAAAVARTRGSRRRR
jgi:hypothetical protein